MYLDLCQKIMNQGVKTEGRNGITYRIAGNHWIFDLEKEFPILTVKKVAFKTAVLEILWIYQQKSNDVRWLQERGIRIWDKFEISEDGYYYNPDNMDASIHKIIHNPADRRNIVTMWQPPFFSKAVLPPCVYKVQFLIMDGKLNSFVEQRSCDTFIGVPFNITQYAALTCMLAHATGLKPGEMHYNMVDVHIYEEHLDQVNEMLERRNLALPAPKLWLNPEINDFYKFDNSKELKDIKLMDYQHLGAIKGIVKA